MSAPTPRRGLRVRVAAAALTAVAGLGAAAAVSAPAPEQPSAGVELAAQIVIPAEPVEGQAYRLELNPLIEQIKAAAGYQSAAVTLTSITGLPPGLTWDRAANIVSGTPTAAGSYTVTISGKGCVAVFCQDMSQPLPVTVHPVGSNPQPTPVDPGNPGSPGTPSNPRTPSNPGAPTGNSGSLGSSTGSLGS